jgi:trk system potassium uptake protein TrkH
MVHTKLTLLLSGLITLISLVMLLIDEAIVGAPLARLPQGEEFWLALFGVVSARTAGLTIFPLESLSEASQLILMVSMFVGGAPASMAGGVTLSTVGVVLATLAATVRGRPQVIVFERTLPLETIGKAVAIMTVSTLGCFVVTLLLLLSGAGALMPVAFEVISAFSNTGYSLGATGELHEFGRVLIALTMFWGRLGPLTLVVLLAQREHPTFARYPAEQIVIG